MRFLLDTHVLVWAMEDPARLPGPIQKIVRDLTAYPLGVAAITPWEIAMLASRGRLRLALPATDWLTRALRPDFTTLIPLSPQIAVESCQLPGQFHADPADRLIVATARIHTLTLITADSSIHTYPHVRSVWD